MQNAGNQTAAQSGTFHITVSVPGENDREFKLLQGVYAIGTDKENKIVLPDPEISWRHAILSLFDDGLWIEDLNSTNGTFLNGNRIAGRELVQPGNQIGVGKYTLTIASSELQATPPPPPMEEAPPPVQAAPPITPEIPPSTPFQTESPTEEASPLPSYLQSNKSARALDPLVKQKISVKSQIHKELHERLNIKRLTASHVGEKELHEKVQTTIAAIIADISGRLPAGMDAESLGKEIYDEAVGLGPLESLLARDDITEIMVNGPSQVYIEKDGKLILTEQTFMSDQSVHAIIERIVAPIGRRIDESQPYVDARLPDGSRVNAIIHPLSLIGPCLTIRKFSKDPYTVNDLIKFNSLSRDLAEFIEACVLLKKNIIVSGGTGTGKTTLLNVISSYLPDDERIITIEDAAELRLTQDHVIRLESRPPNMEGKGAILIRDLVRNALRMRPDRIVVGECRGAEALDMLQAMNTGHEGSLTTIHANTPRDVISRLETMVLMTGMDFPLRAIREQVGAAIHLIVQIGRYSDGTRKVDRITEIVGLEGDKITMQDLFTFTQTGLDNDGKVEGEFKPTGSVPTFMEEIKIRGIPLNHRIFDPHARRND